MQTEASGVDLSMLTCSTTSLAAGTKLRMRRDQILVRPTSWEGAYNSNLVLISRGRPVCGEVVAVGPGVYPWQYNRERTKRWESSAFQPCEVKPGDKIYFGDFPFTELLIGNELHVICREADVCVSRPPMWDNVAEALSA